MKIELFFECIEGLYGKYSEACKLWIVKYFKGWSESDINDLFHYLVIRHKFNTPPNLAVIEDARREFSERYDKTLGKDWYTSRNEAQIQERSKTTNNEKLEEPASPEEAERFFAEIKSRLRHD